VTTEDKAQIYAGLDLQLTYDPGGRTANVRAEVGQFAACILALTCYGNRVEDFGVPGI
jgi:hypothetical protein